MLATPTLTSTSLPLDIDVSLNFFAATQDENDEALFITGTISLPNHHLSFISKHHFLHQAQTLILSTLFPLLRNHWCLPTDHHVFCSLIHELAQMTYYHYSSLNPPQTLNIQKGFLKTQNGELVTFDDFLATSAS